MRARAISGDRPATRAERRRRRGISLVELVVGMGVAAVILTVGGGLLHLLMETERKMSDAVQVRMTLSRLADQFRDDIHASAEDAVALEDEGSRLTLATAGAAVVVWQAEENVVIRTVGDDAAQERYRLPVTTSARFERDAEAGVVGLVLGGRGAAETDVGTRPARLTMRIEAVLGRDIALVQRGEQEPQE